MSETVITVEKVGKRFKLRSGGRTLKSTILDVLRFRGRATRDFWALKDVGFTVGRGETLGIIGINGAGKSTLLSLIAGTKLPTEGTITTRGTISCLLELGAGFHPDLTGRENVFLSGAIMGISKAQMIERMDAIVEFAELQEFIDQPVKHYSSGMYVRLGFAVAVEVNPDILLIDEVLAVGDSAFQKKCIQRMDEFRRQGKTMLIISHDLRTIQSISDRILFLNDGTVQGIGDPDDMVESYESLSRKIATKGMKREWGTGEVTLTGAEFFDKTGKSTDKFNWNDPLEVRVSYDAPARIDNPVFGFAISDTGGRIVYGNNTQIEKLDIPWIQGKGTVTLRLDNILMAAGTYLFSFSVHSADHKTNYHRLDNSFPIAVESEKPFEGYCYMPCKWRK